MADTIRLNIAVSPQLNDRLEQLAESNHSSKTEILRRALALYDVVVQAKADDQRVGILDKNRKLLTEIVGI
jgi:predicted transcriptional regulator